MDGRGVPLSLVVSGANRHDVTQLAALLGARVAKQLAADTGSAPTENLCADAGYAGQPALTTIEDHGYVAHVRSRYDEKTTQQQHPDYRPRRWVVEVCHSWFNRFRKLLVRYEKTLQSFLAPTPPRCRHHRLPPHYPALWAVLTMAARLNTDKL